jgi:hypothetical protein
MSRAGNRWTRCIGYREGGVGVIFLCYFLPSGYHMTMNTLLIILVVALLVWIAGTLLVI